VNDKNKTLPTARRREIKTSSILIRQAKTKIQKFGPTKYTPANTKTKAKIKNDKKTQKTKRDRSQKPGSTQPYRTKLII
jgi:hypothetical protein